MISLGAKFADYGLTGGFAVLGQLALLFWAAPDEVRSSIGAHSAIVANYIHQLPAGLLTPISALLTTVAVISIFFLGLVLEAVGSVAVIWEAHVFKRHLERHRYWLSHLFVRYGPAISEDLDSVVEEFGDPMGKQEWIDSMKVFTVWRRSSRRVIINEHLRIFRRFKLLGSISRIQSLLLSYALAADRASHLELLQGHLQLCRMSRAVSAALFILSIEMAVWLPLSCLDSPPGSRIFELVAIQVTMVVLAIFLPVKACARFCDGLFTLVLVISSKLDEESREPARAGVRNAVQSDHSAAPLS